jgi:hypothetical protein
MAASEHEPLIDSHVTCVPTPAGWNAGLERGRGREREGVGGGVGGGGGWRERKREPGGGGCDKAEPCVEGLGFRVSGFGFRG